MIYDYRKLKGKIIEVFGSQKLLANECNISNSTLSLKLNNKSEWTQDEIADVSAILGIPFTEIPDYFFSRKV